MLLTPSQLYSFLCYPSVFGVRVLRTTVLVSRTASFLAQAVVSRDRHTAGSKFPPVETNTFQMWSEDPITDAQALWLDLDETWNMLRFCFNLSDTRTTTNNVLYVCMNVIRTHNGEKFSDRDNIIWMFLTLTYSQNLTNSEEIRILKSCKHGLKEVSNLNTDGSRIWQPYRAIHKNLRTTSSAMK